MSTPDGAPGGRHRAASATPRLLATAPRVVGIAALAVATAGAASAGSPLGTAQGSSNVSLTAVVSAAGTTAAEMELERPVRVRVSRDGERQAAPQRLGSQAADAVAAAKAKLAQEAAAKAAAEKKAAEKKAAEKKAAEKAAAEAKRWRLPVAKGAYRLTARFGECSGLWAQCHTGLDFAAPNGTPVGAVAAGTVVEAGYSGAYGNRVVVRTADGTEMWYCHLSSFAVSAGEPVRSGQQVGAVGSTGNSTGAHLHLEIHPQGSGAVDPGKALGSQGVRP